eukprot:12286703-Heterocapsa_arctica.AAC.1
MIARAHDGQHCKIMLQVSEEIRPVLTAVLNLLKAMGAQIMHGPPPKGPHERAVEKSLRRVGEA